MSRGARAGSSPTWPSVDLDKVAPVRSRRLFSQGCVWTRRPSQPALIEGLSCGRQRIAAIPLSSGTFAAVERRDHQS